MNHIQDYVALALAIHAVALIIVNLTPTPRDNEALDSISRLGVRLYRALEILAGIVGPFAKR